MGLGQGGWPPAHGDRQRREGLCPDYPLGRRRPADRQLCDRAERLPTNRVDGVPAPRVHQHRQGPRRPCRATPRRIGLGDHPAGRMAFTARVALADLAEKTLDVQYFLWESDATGRILGDRLMRAADRGVRVRILIDDVNLKDRDAGIAALDAHPNVEIRLFNPFAHRGSHLLGFLTDFDRVNHRMHNKLMVMDNALAIVGGRNMSDPVLRGGPRANFRDLDIAAAGPVVRDLSRVFDRFWNGDWSVPIAALVDRPYTEADLSRPRATRTRGDREGRLSASAGRGRCHAQVGALVHRSRLHLGPRARRVRRSRRDRATRAARDVHVAVPAIQAVADRAADRVGLFHPARPRRRQAEGAGRPRCPGPGPHELPRLQ